ncbi:MAG: hypothetical protein KDA65_11220 [Planctomycetaceae bacterium]|nr:hypothetical protein [Planctomycetaceae bacterium]
MNRRFTILTHDFPFLHWDLLVENDESLLSWRLREEPEKGRKIACEPLPDHRRLYLDYEGPVSGDRGTVLQWTTGTCDLQREGESLYRLQVESPRLQGKMILQEEANGEWFCYSPGMEPSSD